MCGAGPLGEKAREEMVLSRLGGKGFVGRGKVGKALSVKVADIWGVGGVREGESGG